ncbi:TPA: hypothetical protein ACPTZG_005347, partial [Escherichia coli]
THHAFSSGAGRTSDGNGSHASTLKSPSYTKSVSWQHYQSRLAINLSAEPVFNLFSKRTLIFRFIITISLLYNYLR